MALTPSLEVFTKYYSSISFEKNVVMPPRPNFHHYRIQRWDGSFARLTRTIRRPYDLRKWISNEIPRNAYFTPTEWLDPSNVRRSKGKVNDYLLSSPLYFDIETKDRDVSQAANMTIRLMRHLELTRQRRPSLVVFSGRRGFHVYYWDWDNIVEKCAYPSDRTYRILREQRKDSCGTRLRTELSSIIR